MTIDKTIRSRFNFATSITVPFGIAAFPLLASQFATDFASPPLMFVFLALATLLVIAATTAILIAVLWLERYIGISIIGVFSDWPWPKRASIVFGLYFMLLVIFRSGEYLNIDGVEYQRSFNLVFIMILGTLIVSWVAGWRSAARRWLAPLVFGTFVLGIWEWVIAVYEIPLVILPAPSDIWTAITSNVPTLWADFVQTVIKSVLPGYAMGCGAAFLTALAIDRSPFLQRGLIPVANLAAALPIVGIAPIMVMWFGFDWQSKAAVVVLMCFFPMLVNTMEGLRASDAMQRDLMRTYAANYGQTLIKLRLPAAAPFVFNGLKICTTLALIGAIVAEFFGTPIVGMGFRISTEVGRLALDMVWAEIAVAAVAGSVFYGLVSLVERAATFWHPSQRV